MLFSDRRQLDSTAGHIPLSDLQETLWLLLCLRRVRLEATNWLVAHRADAADL